jgi:hypothetical protein
LVVRLREPERVTNRGRDEVRLDAPAGLHHDPVDHRIQQLLELLGGASATARSILPRIPAKR